MTDPRDAEIEALREVIKTLREVASANSEHAMTLALENSELRRKIAIPFSVRDEAVREAKAQVDDLVKGEIAGLRKRLEGADRAIQNLRGKLRTWQRLARHMKQGLRYTLEFVRRCKDLERVRGRMLERLEFDLKVYERAANHAPWRAKSK